MVRSFKIIGGKASDHKGHTQLQTPNLAAFGEDGMGEVYYGSTSGQLFKIVKD